MKIAFDVHGTILRDTKNETQAIVELIKILKKAGHYIIVWSSDDVQDTRIVVEELHIKKFVDSVISKMDIKEWPDIAFDDNQFPFSKMATIKV